jgi:putative DNA primase/helicase
VDSRRHARNEQVKPKRKKAPQFSATPVEEMGMSNQHNSKPAPDAGEWAEHVKSVAYNTADASDHNPNTVRITVEASLALAYLKRADALLAEREKGAPSSEITAAFRDRRAKVADARSVFDFLPNVDHLGSVALPTTLDIDAIGAITHAAIEAAVNPPPPAFSDTDLSQRFTAKHVDDYRYSNGRWMYWNGGWQSDEADSHLRHDVSIFCSRLADQERRRGAPAHFVKRLASHGVIRTIEQMVCEMKAIRVPANAWDTSPMLLNTPNGIVELTTGKLRPSARGDYLSKSTTVAPTPYDTGLIGNSYRDCPEFGKFLQWACCGDAELEKYLQRVFGYVLTADYSEQVLFFLFGDGRNGKGTLIGVMQNILGPAYAVIADRKTYAFSNKENHSTELAHLAGARLAVAQETKEGGRWDEAQVKSMVGGDRMAARFVCKDLTEFRPTFKLIFSSNHRPPLTTVDAAMRRRIQMVNFAAKVEEGNVDIRLGEKLQREYPAILRWAITGCLAWQDGGLMPPKAVTDATKQYLVAQDVLGQWLNDCCDVVDDYKERKLDLYQSWDAWAKPQNERAYTSQRDLSAALEKRGLQVRYNHKGQECLVGFRIRRAGGFDAQS